MSNGIEKKRDCGASSWWCGCSAPGAQRVGARLGGPGGHRGRAERVAQNAEAGLFILASATGSFVCTMLVVF